MVYGTRIVPACCQRNMQAHTEKTVLLCKTTCCWQGLHASHILQVYHKQSDVTSDKYLTHSNTYSACPGKVSCARNRLARQFCPIKFRIVSSSSQLPLTSWAHIIVRSECQLPIAPLARMFETKVPPVFHLAADTMQYCYKMSVFSVFSVVCLYMSLASCEHYLHEFKVFPRK